MTTVDQNTAGLQELLDLSGRAAIVTGAAQGLGTAIADRLAEAGAGVVLFDLDAGRVRDAAAGLSGRPGAAIAVAGDVSDPADVRRCVETAVSELGGVDILVNNAGIYPRVPFAQATPDLWRHILDVNLIGSMLLAQAAAAQMTEAGTGGSIVNIASMAAVMTHSDDLIAYGASKAGMVNMTRNLARALAPSGIRVNAVLPGGIATPGVEGTERRQAADIPLGHRADPDEIATTVLFLASPLARYVTGAELLVDGGATL